MVLTVDSSCKLLVNSESSSLNNIASCTSVYLNAYVEYMCVWAAVIAVFKPALLSQLVVLASCTTITCELHS